MEKQEAIKKLEETVGAYLLSGRADDTTCGEWREILETLAQEPCKVTEFDKDHIWYKGQQYISLRRFIEVKKEQELKFIAHSDGTIEQIHTREHGEWIPVSEKTPKELTPVNITWVNRNPESYYKDIKDKPFSATGVYYKGEWYWYSATCEDYLAEYGRAEWDKIDANIEITAWMPLPEPYKEGPKDGTESR